MVGLAQTKNNLIEGLRDFNISFQITGPKQIEIWTDNNHLEANIVGLGVLRIRELDRDLNPLSEYLISVDEFVIAI